jgi:hypothetical protein
VDTKAVTDGRHDWNLKQSLTEARKADGTPFKTNPSNCLVDGFGVKDGRHDNDGMDKPMFNSRLDVLRTDPACDLIPTKGEPKTREGD